MLSAGELGERPALADYPHGSVAGVDQVNGGFNDPAQHDLDMQVAADGHDGEQGIDAVPAGKDGLQPGLQLFKEFIKPEVRQN